MEKDKKYNVVLGLMIFFFLIIVGVSIAWGLGYIGIKNNEVNNDNLSSNNQTVNNSGTNDSPKIENNSGNVVNNNNNKEESNTGNVVNNNTKTLSPSEVESLNKQYSTMYLSAISAGSPEERVQKIMGYASYAEMDSHYTTTVVDGLYKVTDIDYSTFTEKLVYLSQTLKNKIYSFGSETELFKESNGKLAIYQSGWTGYEFAFTSQQLVSNNGNEYVWKVVGNSGTNTVTYNVKGRVENLKYILESVEQI